MLGIIGKWQAIMQIKLTLDDQVDKNLILALQNLSNGGPLAKVLYLVIYEWHFWKCAQSTDLGQSGTDLGQSGTDLGQTDDLSDVINLIKDEW